MSEQIIVTTPTQLQAIISDAVGAIIPRLADFRRKNEAVESDGLTVEQAAQFLTEQGIPTTRATIYSLVFREAIPHRKFGRRTIFSRRELLAWIDERTTRPSQRSAEAAARIAATAARKA